MSEPPSLSERAAAVGVEIHELRREAALSDDVVTLVPLKQCDRALKAAFGRGEHDPGDSYTNLKERIADELYGKVDSEEQAIVARKESLIATVRREVEGELEDNYTELQAAAAALEDREHAVAAREREASPSYRAAFFTVGVGVTLAADLLIRVIA